MDIKRYIANPDDNIRTVIEIIDNNKDGIALIVDQNDTLIGTVTDGDIRRFILSGKSFDEPCRKVMHDRPVKAAVNTERKQLIELIQAYRIRNIPIVDENDRPVKLVNFDELMNGNTEKGISVIMAGGEGIRLRPLTEGVPKPMLRVGDRPVLEQIIGRLHRDGIDDIFISINYCGDVIENYFKDGSDFGVRITYLREDRKLGTAGSLSLLEESVSLLKCPILVMNGDVLTEVSYHRFLEFHRHCRCAMSVAAINYNLKIPYGVVETTGHYVTGLEEKPTRGFLCNAGIYAIEPDLVQLVPEKTFFDMTDLLKSRCKKGVACRCVSDS